MTSKTERGLTESLAIVNWMTPAVVDLSTDADGVVTITSWRAQGIAHGFCGVRSAPPPERLWAKQVHGTDIISASTLGGNPASLPGDGVWSNAGNQPVAVRTADCLPILFHGKTSGNLSMAVAVHGGWRGLSGGIVERAMDLLTAGGYVAEQISVAIGPTIGMDAFEVGPEVPAAFSQGALALSDHLLASCQRPGRDDRMHLDLQKIAVIKLLLGGIPAAGISVLRVCTRSSSDWHSYRREGPGVASNWAWVATAPLARC